MQNDFFLENSVFGAGPYPGKISKHRRSDRNLEKSKISKKPFRSHHCAKFAPKFFTISFYIQEDSNMVRQNKRYRQKCHYIFLEQRPDYMFLRRRLRMFFEMFQFEWDFNFDWTQQKPSNLRD